MSPSIEDRTSLVTAGDFWRPPEGDGFADFVRSLPRILNARSLIQTAENLVLAGRGSLWMLGGHVVKVGLGPLLIRLMDRGLVGAVAVNGAVAIHDWEIARFGRTSEDVAAGLKDGSFGMTEETGSEMNEAVEFHQRAGMGWALALELDRLRDESAAPEHSLLLGAWDRKIQLTVHPAIGCEVIHQHPGADGAALGTAGLEDFRKLADWMPALRMVLNVGSAVIMPEVFLKALSLARSRRDDGRPMGFPAVDFDQIRHYRPMMNVCSRPTDDGRHLTGHHEIMLPLLAGIALEIQDGRL